MAIQGFGPKRVRLLDFNHDGKKDLAATGRGPIQMLLGNGDGTFQAAVALGTFNLGENPDFIADFNHDNNADVLVESCSPFRGCGEFLLLNNGDATFSSPPGTNKLQAGVDISGDFDGDGNIDLLGPLSVNGSPEIGVFLGNGDGSFQAPVTFSASTGFRSLPLAADLNDDKAADFVIASGDGTISVVLNSGTDFTLSASPLTPSSIGAGQSSTSTVSLQLLNLFNNPVALSCSVQPAQAGAPTCSFNAGSVSFDASGKASATLTVSGGSFALLKHRSPMNSGAPVWFPIVGFALLGTGFTSRVHKKRTFFRVVPFAALLALISLQACGGGEGSPKSTNYTITINGTSGQTSHSTTVNVTVH